MLKKIISFVLFLSLSFILLGCSKKDVIEKIEMYPDYDKKVEIGSFDYGAYAVEVIHSVEKKEIVFLTEDMISEADKLLLYQPGEHEIEVNYLGKTCILSLEVVRRQFDDDLRCDPVEVVYDGLNHKLAVEGTLPKGATIMYSQINSFTEAGTYQVTVTIYCETYEVKTFTTQMVIKKADYDMSGIVFADKTYIYNGKNITLSIPNLPNDLSASFTILDENQKEVPNGSLYYYGTYDVTVNFTCSNKNYNDIEPIHAVITIIDQNEVKQ